MSDKLEVFFDYACPFCMKGHAILNEIRQTPLFIGVEVVWRPCEAHPRPETHGPHSDLCIQGFLHARAHAPAAIERYHALMYDAALGGRADIENPAELAELAGTLMDGGAFLKALKNGDYAEEQRAGNDYAYGQSGVWAVPSYRMNGEKLDAVEGVGVTKEQLVAFIKRAKK